MPDVTLLDIGRTIAVPDGQTILSAALDAGIDYPHGCKSGRCGRCKSRLLGGQVDHLDHTRFALTAEEREAGLILACRAVPVTDAKVAWLGEARTLGRSQAEDLART
ncbi:2Fe-2S iron-sulfur cluster-binding protein [Tabrizicola sp.]|uniref:2Fe-2S iron-sulfur cluster-binding protein n=1 Tax=Tabrizicola sp. TaxID=2005166 RepID=UPI0025E7789B|nr:2Fe-2S iron-sulfur cluster-binding protein [Tabrizicola sp.]